MDSRPTLSWYQAAELKRLHAAFQLGGENLMAIFFRELPRRALRKFQYSEGLTAVQSRRIHIWSLALWD